MKAIQLELDFRSANSWCVTALEELAFAQALAEPEVADLRQLWRSIGVGAAGLTEKARFRIGRGDR
jgi:hypothetical protein